MSPAAPRIDVIRSRQDLNALEPDWNRLIAEDSTGITGLDSSATFAWSTTLIDTKLQQDDWWVLVARTREAVTGILPLFRRRRGKGIARTEARLLHDVHGGRGGLLVAADAPDTVRHLVDAAFRECGSIACLTLTLCEGSRSHALLQGELSASFLRVNAVASLVSPYIHSDGEPEQYVAQLDKEFRDVLRRRTKRLQAMGTVSVRAFRDAASVAELMRIIQSVENASWKNDAGTSITSNEEQARFYEVLVPRLAETGMLESMAILLDDRPIAYQLGTRTGDTVLGLKTSFDNALRSVAPGTIMSRIFLDHLHGIGCPVFDLMGEAEPYKMKWTGLTYRRRSYRCFARNASGVVALAQETARSLTARGAAQLSRGVGLLRQAARREGV